MLRASPILTAVFFLHQSFKLWEERKKPEEKYEAYHDHLNQEFCELPQGLPSPSPHPPSRIGTSGGVTMVIEDRTGIGHPFPVRRIPKSRGRGAQTARAGRVTTTFTPTVPQTFVTVDRDKVLKQGSNLSDVYRHCRPSWALTSSTTSTVWPPVAGLRAGGRGVPDQARQLGQFYVRTVKGDMVPLSAVTSFEQRSGPEFTMRYNLYRSAQSRIPSSWLQFPPGR